MKRILYVSAVFSVCVGTAALASTGQQDATQAQMDASSSQTWKKADAALEKFYQTYAKRLDANQIKLFKTANAAWLVYRKAFCKFQASGSSGGSVYPMVYADCMAAQSSMRLHELNELLVSPCRHEGNLSCPAWSSSVPNNSIQRTQTRYAGSRR